MTTAALLRSIRRRKVPSAPFSKRAGNDVIGIDLGTTNSCVAVMEGKLRSRCHTSFAWY
ncbi:hypothetical protein F2Q68_00000287 [Brassica cretica]|uniref:Uncharacterized protein n=1 Tax=Brassica cretica TaxID=69181 RepID=A0A8S9JEY9_BRACR|nr:hypothetical protein F2Q68_00000287 [Brassica cretica]